MLGLFYIDALVAYEGIPLHLAYFCKLWCEIYQTDKQRIKQLCQSNYLIDYMEGILHDDRLCLNNQHVYQFFVYYFKLVSCHPISHTWYALNVAYRDTDTMNCMYCLS